MNGTEQKARHTAVAALAARQGNVEVVVEALAQEIVGDRHAYRATIGDTQQRCDDRRVEAEAITLRLYQRLTDLEAREAARTICLGSGFRGRLGLVARGIRWVFTGREWRA